MKILLLAFNVQKSGFSLGLAYLKGYLAKTHPEVEVVIKEFSFGSQFSYATNKNVELAALSYIQLEQPDVVAFSCYIWSGEAVRDFAHAIKRTNSQITVVVGGVEVTAEHLGSVDYAIYGEGELAFSELVDHLQGKRAVTEVANVIALQDGKLIKGPKHELEHLDDLVFPYTQIPPGEYPLIRLETARGCLFSCNFCHYAQPTLRHFSLSYLEEWLSYLFTHFTFPYLTIFDANFNTNAPRMFAILDLIEKYKTGPLTLHIELRPELITSEMAQKFTQYTFTISAELGLQSTDQKVLQLANRPTVIEKVKDGLEALEKNNIHYKIDLMYGLPGDTFYKFLLSARFLLAHSSQSRLVAHHYMQLNNTASFSGIERLSEKSSSMVVLTPTQNVVDLTVTKLFIDMVNRELRSLE